MGDKSLYYEDLQGRLRALLIMVAGQLPRTTVALATEMVDANESGVALETISEMLVESGGRLSADALSIVSDLVGTMGLDRDVVERLRPLVTASDTGAHE